jgi:FkbM family methyltransferase
LQDFVFGDVVMERDLPSQEEDTRVKIFDHRDLRLLLDPTSFVDRQIILFGAWEPAQLTYLFELISERSEYDNRIFLDIGSYFGLYSLLAAKSKQFSEIFAFEADRYTFGQLHGNIFLNKFERSIVASCVAVSDKSYEGNFWESRYHPEGNRGGVGLASSPSRETTHVQCLALDEVFDFVDRDIVIKIDVEGHEIQALSGMKRLLSEISITLQVEAYEPSQQALFELAVELNLKHLKTVDVDHYFVNWK